MPSSTSSSNSVPPNGSVKPWLLALVLAVGVLAGLEALARSNGHRPSVADDAQLWSYWRKQASSEDSRTVALIGGSKIELGFSPATFKQIYPEYALVQLAVNGTQPVASLRDLAADSSFRGVVICDATEQSLEKEYWDSQEHLVRQYRAGAPLDAGLNLRASLFVQTNFAMAGPFLNLAKIGAVAVASRRFRAPYHVTTFPDRSQEADFRKIHDLTAFHEQHVRRVRATEYPDTTPEQWLASFRTVDAMAAQVRARGGKVVFLRMPIGPALSKSLDHRYPRRLYWDAAIARSRSVFVRADDYPALSDFNVPDEAHLDFRDTPRFTRALACVLGSKGVLPQKVPTDACPAVNATVR